MVCQQIDVLLFFIDMQPFATKEDTEWLLGQILDNVDIVEVHEVPHTATKENYAIEV